MIRIRADLNRMDKEGNIVYLNTQNLSVLPGTRVIIFAERDYEVEATFEKDVDERGREYWFAVPIWSTFRDIPFDDTS